MEEPATINRLIDDPNWEFKRKPSAIVRNAKIGICYLAVVLIGISSALAIPSVGYHQGFVKYFLEMGTSKPEIEQIISEQKSLYWKIARPAFKPLRERLYKEHGANE